MVTWKAFEEAEPEFAARVRALFDAGRHKTIATLRADGSPRISGIEIEFDDGQLGFGSMTAARKGDDLRRDGRCAIHSPTTHPGEGREGEWPGEAKVSGRARSLGAIPADGGDGQPHGESFVVDIEEVVITGLNPEATRLAVEWWTETGGRQRIERD